MGQEDGDAIPIYSSQYFNQLHKNLPPRPPADDDNVEAGVNPLIHLTQINYNAEGDGETVLFSRTSECYDDDDNDDTSDDDNDDDDDEYRPPPNNQPPPPPPPSPPTRRRCVQTDFLGDF
ncbi:unnamed protein product [Orchesella dallaii]|uniref:Uncharacterized protein n=1 Tax=Orchesella dallaii TaxID=48710 RepID=A0ABP1PIH4_9HEXA